MENDWGYENLDDDLAELNRNLLELNKKGILKAEAIQNQKKEKGIKKLLTIFGRKK